MASKVARSSRAGTNLSVIASPTMRASGDKACKPGIKVLRNPSLKSWVLSVAVQTWRSFSRVLLSIVVMARQKWNLGNAFYNPHD
jgi:hypothetical protein